MPKGGGELQATIGRSLCPHPRSFLPLLCSASTAAFACTLTESVQRFLSSSALAVGHGVSARCRVGYAREAAFMTTVVCEGKILHTFSAQLDNLENSFVYATQNIVAFSAGIARPKSAVSCLGELQEESQELDCVI